MARSVGFLGKYWNQAPESDTKRSEDVADAAWVAACDRARSHRRGCAKPVGILRILRKSHCEELIPNEFPYAASKGAIAAFS